MLNNKPLNRFCLLLLIVSLTALPACNSTGGSPAGNIGTGAQTSPPDETGSELPDNSDPLPDSAESGVTDPIVLALNWLPSPGDIDGYLVHSGPTPETADVLLTETPSTSIVYDASKDLGLKPGDTACFRIKAFNVYGTSDFSGAACFAITA